MPLVPELCHPGGEPSLGALAIAVDVAAAGVAMRTIAPDWLATSDLAIHTIDPTSAAWSVAEPRILRTGKTTIVFDVLVSGYDSEVSIEKEPGRPLARATMTFVRISRPQETAGLEHPVEAQAPEKIAFALPESGLRRHFYQELGLRVTNHSRGELELPQSGFAANSFGSLQGGVVATLAQAAGESASRFQSGRPGIATDLAVHYLAQGKGPYETRCTLLRGTASQAVHRVEVHDRPTRTLMAVATVHA